MNKILFSVLFAMMQAFAPAWGQVSNGRKVDGTYMPGLAAEKNYVINGVCEKNTAGITASGGTLERGTTTPLNEDSGTECEINASASGQTYTWAFNTFGERLNGGNCAVEFVYQGDASLYKAYIVNDGNQITADLQLTNVASGAKAEEINFPCGDLLTANDFRVASTDNAAAAISVIVTHVGKARNIGSGQASLPTIQKFTSGSGTYIKPGGVSRIVVLMVGGGGGGGGASTAGGGGGSSSFGTYTANGGSGGATHGGVVGGSGGTVSSDGVTGSDGVAGGPTATSNGGAGGTSCLGGAGNGGVANGGSGSSGKTNSGSGGGGGSGTGTSGAGGGGSGGCIPYVSIDNPDSSISYAVGAGGAAGTGAGVGGAGGSGYIEVTEYYESQTAVRMDQAGWYVDATMDGGNPDMGVTSVTSYTEIIDAGLTLKPQSGSAAVGTMCSATNAATAPSTSNTTCAAGSESVGINFAIPKVGAYEVCFYGGHFMSLDTSEAVNAAFQLVETPTNAQTLTLEGGTRTQSSLSGGSTSGTSNGVTHPMSNCSVFNWTSSGTKGVRLMFEQNVSGTPNQNLLLADADANVGQRNMRWTVKPWNNLENAPLLVGGVTSSSTVHAGGATGLTSVDYGTYSATITNVTNTASITTPQSCNYMRVGNIVNVACPVTHGCTTAAGTDTTYGVSLPVASNLAAQVDLSGTFGSPNTSETGRIYADAVNERAEVNFACQNTGASLHTVVFQYVVN